MIDITNISTMSQPQIVELCHNATAIPSLIIALLGILLIFLIVGITAIKMSRGNARFWIIWLISSIFSFFLIFILVIMPNTIQAISNFVIDIFS